MGGDTGVRTGDMDPPKPRECHIKKSPNFNGYGFNLHTEKNKEGQIVGVVDPGSPAEAAGLKKGDKILQVNGTHIGLETHAQVVARIKAGGDETKIFVVDKECLDWHTDHGVSLLPSLPYTVRLSSDEKDECVVRPRLDTHTDQETQHVLEAPHHQQDQLDVKNAEDAEDVEDGEDGTVITTSSSDSNEDKDTIVVPPPLEHTNYTTGPASSSDEVSDELVAGLRLRKTAAEMRLLVSSQKKKDPRLDKIDLKKKAEIIKNL